MSLSQVEINGANYVTYASIAEADIWLAIDAIRGNAWSRLTETVKATHLVAASRRINLESFKGEKFTPETPLAFPVPDDYQWPRKDVVCDGVELPDGIIPSQVEAATIIIAGTIPIDPNAAASSTASNTGVKKLKADTVEVEFGTFTQTSSSTVFNLRNQNVDAFTYLKCLLRNSGSTGFGRIGSVSGVGGGPSFEPSSGPGLTSGLL